MTEYLNISFNNKKEWNAFEKVVIIQAIYKYYGSSPAFKNAMDTDFNQINVITETHVTDHDPRSHFNITLFNNFSNKECPRRATTQSQTIHCYWNTVTLNEIYKMTMVIEM